VNEVSTPKQSLAAIRRQTDLILQATGDGVYGLNAEGKTIFANPAAARLTGFSTEEMLGNSQHELSHHSHSDGSSYDVHECPIYLAFMLGVDRIPDMMRTCVNVLGQISAAVLIDKQSGEAD